MLRLAELGFVVFPVALIALAIALGRRGGPSRRLIAGLAAALVFGEAGLGYYALQQRIPAGEQYIPAHMEDGRIVQGHGG